MKYTDLIYKIMYMKAEEKSTVLSSIHTDETVKKIQR